RAGALLRRHLRARRAAVRSARAAGDRDGRVPHRAGGGDQRAAPRRRAARHRRAGARARLARDRRARRRPRLRRQRRARARRGRRAPRPGRHARARVGAGGHVRRALGGGGRDRDPGAPAREGRRMIRVVLADDHNIVRAGLRALLQGLPDVEVVAEAADGREALAAVAAHRPDVALIDIAMPGLNGLEAAARIAKDAPGTRVVILSMHSAESYVAQALRVGVSGYVLKDAFSDELPVLLRSVMRGETYLSPGISKQVVDRLRARLDEGDTSPDALTPRQRE